MIIDGDGNTTRSLCSWNGPQELREETGGIGKIETIQTEIDQNTEKSSGDLKRLAVTQPSVKKPPDNAGVK